MVEYPPLTNRQIQILRCVIEEYIKEGSAVGSDTIDRKFNLGISPATIRNEMVILTQQGYLSQPHTSSGRTPTSLGLKFYIHQLMQEKDLSVSEEVEVKSKIWDYRDKVDHLLREATRTLAQKTDNIALTLTDQGDIYHSGYANILDLPEFYDIDVTKSVLSMLDDMKKLQNLLSQEYGEETIHILLGDDFNMEYMAPCGMVFIDISLGHYGKGRMGVLGPSRLNYAYIIPVIRYFGRLIDEITRQW